MKLMLSHDITFKNGNNKKIYNYDKINSINELLSLIKMLNSNFKHLFDFSYNGKIIIEYDKFIEDIKNNNIEDFDYIDFKSDNNVSFFLDLVNNRLSINYYKLIIEKLKNEIVYYQYEDKIVKHNKATDTFYQLGKDNKWYTNQYLFDKYYDMNTDFTKIDFDETQRGLKK